MRRTEMTPAHANVLGGYALTAGDLQMAKALSYERGEFICQERQPASNMLLIVRGRAKVCANGENGRSLLLGFYRAGELLGDLEFMADRPRWETSVQAITPMVCVGIPMEQNGPSLKDNLPFLRCIGAGLARKLDQSSKNGANNILYPLETRLCSYIEFVSGGDDYFGEKLTEVAELLGTSYRHLLRCVEKLRARGILEREGNGYRIADRSGLKQYGGVVGWIL